MAVKHIEPKWSTRNLKQDGQTDWLVRLYEKTISGIRANGGLPTEIESILQFYIPTASEQAKVMRFREILPPGHNIPSGII